MSNGKLYTPKEVAEILRMNLLTVYDYIRTGELKAVNFGRNYRIDEQDLINFINSHRVQQSAYSEEII